MWSANDAALERFGYPVSFVDLKLSEKAIQEGAALANRLQDERFDVDASAFLIILRHELGPDFEILDERALSL